jgi:predicted nucleic acid-binding Zn ribbon protein
MSEDALTDCPECKKSALVRQVQPVGFALKGSGWYVTDFRDKGKAAAKSGDGDSVSKPESTTETKPAETKAAASAD